jgi:hypothetical protein
MFSIVISREAALVGEYFYDKKILQDLKPSMVNIIQKGGSF